jgi:Fe-S cluster biosynthesis and repair protein YggX
MSRAYQLLGQALIQTEQLDEAQTVLTRGYVKAAEQGDVMPQKAMGALLQEKLGMPLPRVEQAEAPAAPVSGDQVLDRRTGQVGERMPDPPMRGPLGQFIYDNYSMETWREWIATGTKVINELRLDFSNAQHQELYEQHMKEWLGISDEEVAEYDKQNNEG